MEKFSFYCDNNRITFFPHFLWKNKKSRFHSSEVIKNVFFVNGMVWNKIFFAIEKKNVVNHAWQFLRKYFCSFWITVIFLSNTAFLHCKTFEDSLLSCHKLISVLLWFLFRLLLYWIRWTGIRLDWFVFSVWCLSQIICLSKIWIPSMKVSSIG